MNKTGKGVGKDVHKAAELFQRASDMGHAAAMNNLIKIQIIMVIISASLFCACVSCAGDAGLDFTYDILCDFSLFPCLSTSSQRD